MFELRKSFTFEASHQLHHHDGKCSRLHGHSYTLTVELRGTRLHKDGPQKNMLTDFHHISVAVKSIIKTHLDHHHLNDSLETDSPTAEYIAQWVYRKLLPSLPLLTAVEIRETASASATYRPQRRRLAIPFDDEDNFICESITAQDADKVLPLDTKCADDDDPKSDDTNGLES